MWVERCTACTYEGGGTVSLRIGLPDDPDAECAVTGYFQIGRPSSPHSERSYQNCRASRAHRSSSDCAPTVFAGILAACRSGRPGGIKAKLYTTDLSLSSWARQMLGLNVGGPCAGAVFTFGHSTFI